MVDVGELRSVPLFGGLTSDDLATLAERADLVEAEVGVDLTREGDFGHCVLAIVDGTAAVTVDGGDLGRILAISATQLGCIREARERAFLVLFCSHPCPSVV